MGAFDSINHSRSSDSEENKNLNKLIHSSCDVLTLYSRGVASQISNKPHAYKRQYQRMSSDRCNKVVKSLQKNLLTTLESFSTITCIQFNVNTFLGPTI